METEGVLRHRLVTAAAVLALAACAGQPEVADADTAAPAVETPVAGLTATVPASPEPIEASPQALADAVRLFRIRQNDMADARFRYAFADLDGDAVDDAVVILISSNWCGTGGCTMVVFRGTGDGYSLVSTASVTDEPIRVSPRGASGWKSLIVYSRAKGDVVMAFDGTNYPPNPSLEDEASAAEVEASQTLELIDFTG